MTKGILLLFLTIICVATYCQTPQTVGLADSLIKAGKFKIAITSYQFPTEIKILQEKALTNLKKDPYWSKRYIVGLVERGDKDLGFMEEYGLTPAEFVTMLNGFKLGEYAVLSDTGTISIKKQNGVISFTSRGKFSILNYLTINTKTQTISLDKLVVRKERKLLGQMYAPTLEGFESFKSAGTVSAALQNQITHFGFSVGINKWDTRTCISLGYGKNISLLEPPQFLVVTIF